MGHHRAPRPLRPGAVLVAAVLAIALGVVPSTARPVLAAETLRTQADTVYTIDPAAGRVHVAIAFKANNLKPNSASFIYFYRQLGFALQPEASGIKASDSTGALSVTTKRHDQYMEATVRLRANLYYRDTTSFTIRYDLVGGEPRSASPIRVGAAFASFGIWAWGDPGRSTVVVHTPPGFGSQFDGGPLTLDNSGPTQVLRAEPADPETWYARITSENTQAYTDTRLSLPGGVEILVKAWPEDDKWGATVGATLRKAVPELESLIGLPWPVQHDLDIRERFTPLLEGYAGVFLVDEQRIDVSEDLDPVVIVHEASHAWLNNDLFVERWIYEGLAQEYAWLVQTKVGGENGGPPRQPKGDAPGFVKLTGWTHPLAIRDQQTDNREQFGYDASFWVIHQIVQAAGAERMKMTFNAAQADATAYAGAVAPEKVAASDGWKRLLDLAESIDDPVDSPEIEKAMRDFVLTAPDAAALTAREAARQHYRALLADGHGWLPGWYVRKPMGEWSFGPAGEAMDEAAAVLTLRDQVTASASALGLQPDGALETAYQDATDGLTEATSLGHEEIDALAAIGDAKTKVEAPRDLLTQLGLVGETPAVPYDAARSAFEHGDLDAAVASAASAAALIGGAAANGQQRLIVGIAVAVGVVVLFVVLIVLLRRRRRRRALALAAAIASPLDLVGAPDAIGPTVAIDADTADPDLAQTQPYATLAADPAAVPPPAVTDLPDLEGGPARGESPADS